MFPPKNSCTLYRLSLLTSNRSSFTLLHSASELQLQCQSCISTVTSLQIFTVAISLQNGNDSENNFVHFCRLGHFWRSHFRKLARVVDLRRHLWTLLLGRHQPGLDHVQQGQATVASGHFARTSRLRCKVSCYFWANWSFSILVF